MANIKKNKKLKYSNTYLKSNKIFIELVKNYGLNKFLYTHQDYFELNFETKNKKEILIIFNLQNIINKNYIYKVIIKNLIYFVNLKTNKYSYKFIFFKNSNNFKLEQTFIKIAKKITKKVYLGFIFDNLDSKKNQIYVTKNRNYSLKILSNIFMKNINFNDEIKKSNIHKLSKIFVNNIANTDFSIISLTNDYIFKKLKNNLNDNFLYNFFYIIENNLTLSSKLVCEPFFEKYKLFFKKDDGNTIKKDTRLMMEILTYSDKKNDLLDISNLYNQKFIYMHKLYNKLQINKIIY